MQGVTLAQIHPVLDGKNRPIFEPTAFDINTSIQRCLVKAIALHGLGLYVYAGEDLPDGETQAAATQGVAPIHRHARSPSAQQRFLERLMDEAGRTERRLLEYFGVASTAELPMAEFDRAHHGTAASEAEGGMSTIVRLVQGSTEWHEHRRQYRNASETPVVLGVSPWQTPYQLWQQKLGRTEPEVTPAMLHGTQLEPAARAAYEQQTGLVMQPLVVVDGEYSASLDGLTLAGERIVEIKCPRQGARLDIVEDASQRAAPARALSVPRCSISSWSPRPRSPTCSCSTAPRASSSRWRRIRAAGRGSTRRGTRSRTASPTTSPPPLSGPRYAATRRSGVAGCGGCVPRAEGGV